MQTLKLTKRLLAVLFCYCICFASFAQTAGETVLYSESLDAKWMELGWLGLDDQVRITMSVVQADKEESYLSWRCKVIDLMSGQTKMDFEAPGTLGYDDYREDDHFFVVTGGSSKYRLVVDVFDLSSFQILEVGKESAETIWYFELDSKSKNDWIDHYLCWALYSNYIFVDAVLRNTPGMSALLKPRIGFMMDIVNTFPDGISKKRDKRFVTPKQLAGRLEDQVTPSAYTKAVTRKEKGPKWDRFAQILSGQTAPAAYPKETGSDQITEPERKSLTKDQINEANLKDLVRFVFKQMVDANSIKEISMLNELLEPSRSELTFPSADYLKRRIDNNYSILEMLQHPCLYFPTFMDSRLLSPKKVSSRLNRVFPYAPERRSYDKDCVYLPLPRASTMSGYRIEGEMEIVRNKINKDIWSHSYSLYFNNLEEAKSFYCDVCAELACSGFIIHHYGEDNSNLRTTFDFEMKVPEGKHTQQIDYSVDLFDWLHLDNTMTWRIVIKGTVFRY